LARKTALSEGEKSAVGAIFECQRSATSKNYDEFQKQEHRSDGNPSCATDRTAHSFDMRAVAYQSI